MAESFDRKRHDLRLLQRERAEISGVEEVLSFDEESVWMETTEGALTIHGSGLKVEKLNIEEGEVWIEGNVDSVEYGKESGTEKMSMLKRLFR